MLKSRDELQTRDRYRLRPGEVLGILLFWGFLATLTATGRLLDPRIPELRPDIGSAVISLAFIEYSIWAALTFPIIGLVNRVSAGAIGRDKWASRTTLVVVGLAVAMSVSTILWIVRSRLLFHGPPGRHPPWYGGIFRGEFVGDLILYAAVLGAAFARNYFLQSQTRLDETRLLQAEAAKLQARLAEAQLAALRTQLNPHFLFNTLNAISTLVERDPRGVRRMIARLSELLRHTLEQTEEHEVSIDRELALLQRYLDIMAVRFGDRLEVALDVDGDVRAALVPNLVLQPLVENALKHGVDAIESVGRVEVAAKRDGDDVILTVRDNGPGPNGVKSDSGVGVGLRNTQARLQQLYGTRQHFELRRAEGGGTIARIRLPFHTEAVAT
jgi:two-component system, LytTR family, sensor kinase